MEVASKGWHLDSLMLAGGGLGHPGASRDVTVDVIADDEVVVVHNELLLPLADLSNVAPPHTYQWKRQDLNTTTLSKKSAQGKLSKYSRAFSNINYDLLGSI